MIITDLILDICTPDDTQHTHSLSHTYPHTRTRTHESADTHTLKTCALFTLHSRPSARHQPHIYHSRPSARHQPHTYHSRPSARQHSHTYTRQVGLTQQLLDDTNPDTHIQPVFVLKNDGGKHARGTWGGGNRSWGGGNGTPRSGRQEASALKDSLDWDSMLK